MNEFQFDFNPITPVPSGSGKIPWASILFGLGLLAIIIVIAYQISKPEIEQGSLVSDKELPDNDIL